MIRVRFAGIIFSLLFIGLFFIGLIQNPLFFIDLWRAMRDVSLELTLTGLLVGWLLWLGLEVNHSVNRVGDDGSLQTSFRQGISTEMIGAVISTVLLGMVVLVFQQYQDIQGRKAELILQMGSPDNAFAVEASRILADEGWLFDSTLHNASLERADLQDANLKGANLQGVNLFRAVLQDVTFSEANLQGANLERVNLQDTVLQSANLQNAVLKSANLKGAVLGRANLQGANLNRAILLEAYLAAANLQGADLSQANLQGANLGQANLQGANLAQANLQDTNLVGAILPDGTEWIVDTDMGRFTNQQHPEYCGTLVGLNRLRQDLGVEVISTEVCN